MEKRWSRRVPVQWGTRVVTLDGRLITGQARNVSLEGMFMEVDRNGLEHNDLVRLRFGLPIGPGEVRTYEVPAGVVHKAPDGVGLFFAEFDQDLFRRLRDMLYPPGRGARH